LFQRRDTILPVRTHWIATPAQAAALVSPVRQEILDVLARIGTASIAEIAETLGRPADALYYHLKQLVRVRLVVQSVRSRGRRPEALYRTVAPMLALHYGSPLTPRIVGSMLRLGARDFRRAFARGGVPVMGPRRELWALRTTGWLTPAGVAGVNRSMRALRDTVSRPGRRGRLYAITILLTPLDRSRRRR
jgi:DNA-binding transcriptional ArsR family regulator